MREMEAMLGERLIEAKREKTFVLSGSLRPQ